MLKPRRKLAILFWSGFLMAGCATVSGGTVRPITGGERVPLIGGSVPAPGAPWGIVKDLTAQAPWGYLTVLATGDYSVVPMFLGPLLISAPGPIGIGPWTGNEMILVYSKWLAPRQLEEYKSVEEIKTMAKNKVLEWGATDIKEISTEYEDILKFRKGKMFALAYKAGGRNYRVVHAFITSPGPKPDSHVVHDFSYIRMEKPGIKDRFDDFMAMLGSLQLRPHAGTHPAVSAVLGAAAKGDMNAVRALVAQGTDVDTKDEKGWTPLVLAAWNGHAEVTKFLLSAGARVDGRTDLSATALMAAAEKGDAETVKVLLAAGANVNAQTHLGGTALMFAAWNGHTEAVKLLVAAGADVNAQDNDRQTALIGATARGHSAVIQLLKTVAPGAR